MPSNGAAVPGDGDGPASGEIMLFGVRVVVDFMRKSVSMNNLSQYEHPQDASNNNSSNKEDVFAAGYASAEDAAPHSSGGNRERQRKRGIPWTEEEHKLFLLGLQKVGRGDWRGIARNYVKTRTPTQVASHAQKYFLRRSNLNRRRRRSSLLDITTDMVSAIPMGEELQIQHQDNGSHAHPVCGATPETSNINGFRMMPVHPMGVNSGAISVQVGNPMEKLTLGQGYVEQKGPTKLPVVPDPKPSTVSDITASWSSSAVDPPTLSLGLSLSSDQGHTPARHAALHAMPCFNNGDSIVSVA